MRSFFNSRIKPEFALAETKEMQTEIHRSKAIKIRENNRQLELEGASKQRRGN